MDWAKQQARLGWTDVRRRVVVSALPPPDCPLHLLANRSRTGSPPAARRSQFASSTRSDDGHSRAIMTFSGTSSLDDGISLQLSSWFLSLLLLLAAPSRTCILPSSKSRPRPLIGQHENPENGRPARPVSRQPSSPSSSRLPATHRLPLSVGTATRRGRGPYKPALDTFE